MLGKGEFAKLARHPVWSGRLVLMALLTRHNGQANVRYDIFATGEVKTLSLVMVLACTSDVVVN